MPKLKTVNPDKIGKECEFDLFSNKLVTEFFKKQVKPLK
jgi:hypothetical protein